MPDYSGGYAGQSSFGQELTKEIKAGQTVRQQNRNLREKIAIGGIQAALMGARGIASASQSQGLQAKQADDALRASAEKYKAPDYTGPSGDVPAWLGKRGSSGDTDALQHNDGVSPDDGSPNWLHSMPAGPSMQERAEAALRNGQQNDSADMAPLGGYYTPDGSQASSDQANALTNDMKTAEDGMRGGGMMNTNPRKGLY